MKHPYLSEIAEQREMNNIFRGLNHTPSCEEGAFYDMKNMSTRDYPVMSPRKGRTVEKTFTKFQGMLDKEGLVYVDNCKLYINDTAKLTGLQDNEKTLVKMGAYIVIFPDKIWYNTKDNTTGYMENTVTAQGVTFTVCTRDGSAITYHDSAYYEDVDPDDNDYKMETINGKTSLLVYSKASGIWTAVATPYTKIEATNISLGFEKGDGVKLSITLGSNTWDYAKNIFPNEEGAVRSNNFVIDDMGSGYIIVPALIDENKTFDSTVTLKAERKCPDMKFVVECQNRLWGCSQDGHEIYCCKLGDVKNWNCFAGISTDSWTATIGSDGEFTGVANYLGYPMFFKENSIIRVTISSIGAHSTKETVCRGIEAGSHKSLVQLNELLYYKANNAVVVYDGNFPAEISKNLGGDRYSEAIGGSIDNRYYISMKKGNERTLFVYDALNGLWAKEDNLPIKQFEKEGAYLYFVADNKLYKIDGGDEDFEWSVESGNIGFASPDKKIISRISIRLSLPVQSHMYCYLKYDSSDIWEFLFEVNGIGTKTFTVPIRPHRCDHFKYMLVGTGDAKIFSLTKGYTEGSDT